MIIVAAIGLAVAGLVVAAPSTHVPPPDTSGPATTVATFTPSDRSPADTFSVPTNIASDCSVDVTSALNAWLASVSDGSTVLFSADGCYWLDGSITLTDRHDLTFDGRGAELAARTTFPATPKISRPMIDVLGGTAITLTDLTLTGTNQGTGYDKAREWLAGIRFRGVVGALVDQVDGKNLWGDFVSLTPDTRPADDQHATNVIVRNSTTATVGRSQVMCNGCQNVLVTGNTFVDTGYQVFNIEVEASWWHAADIAYTNNVISGRIPLSVLVNAGIGQYVRNVIFAGNTMTATPLSCHSPIFILDTPPEKSGFTITNNSLRTLGAMAKIAGASDVTVEGNTTQLTPGGGCEEPGTAIRVSNATGVVKHNTFKNFTRVAADKVIATHICSNRLNGESFNQPAICAPAQRAA